jgi:DNA-binding CsgD family transcriptional regulator/catechol 2,3-dioxygenase-like lactoylglutathione lyase family enzyme
MPGADFNTIGRDAVFRFARVGKFGSLFASLPFMKGREGPGRPPYPDILTPAEWQAVDGIRHGLTNRQLANRLGVSVDAIKYHVANALQKLGFSNRTELRSWDGVARTSALFGQERTMSKEFRLGKIGQISRQVSDIPAAVRWYKDVLGLQHLYTFGDLAFFDCAGVRLYLSLRDKADCQESVLYFQVDSIHAAYDVLSSRGVQFINAPHMIHRHADGTEEWLAAFNDPDGHPLQLISHAKPQIA